MGRKGWNGEEEKKICRCKTEYHTVELVVIRQKVLMSSERYLFSELREDGFELTAQ